MQRQMLDTPASALVLQLRCAQKQRRLCTFPVRSSMTQLKMGHYKMQAATVPADSITEWDATVQLSYLRA